MIQKYTSCYYYSVESYIFICSTTKYPLFTYDRFCQVCNG